MSVKGILVIQPGLGRYCQGNTVYTACSGACLSRVSLSKEYYSYSLDWGVTVHSRAWTKNYYSYSLDYDTAVKVILFIQPGLCRQCRRNTIHTHGLSMEYYSYSLDWYAIVHGMLSIQLGLGGVTVKGILFIQPGLGRHCQGTVIHTALSLLPKDTFLRTYLTW